MNQYLVILSIGPVQSMIAAARRSRDLWSGSWLLSELAKACAKSLQEQGATLIFPHVEKISLLDANSSFSVGNKLQVRIEADSSDDIAQIVDAAKHATNQRFLVEAKAAIDQLGGITEDIRQDIWEAQKDSYLEIQAAWAEIDTSKSDGYKLAIRKAASTLAARKATRDFSAAATNPYDTTRMLPKSSLDGAFETILNKPQNRLKQKTRAKLSLSDSEQLDCLGTIKRLGFADIVEQFTPFTRITAHAWIEEHLCAHENYIKIKAIYDELVKQGIATKVRGNIDHGTKKSIYGNFPYDAQLLYSYRLDAAIQQWNQLDDAIGDQLKLLKQQLQPIWKQHGEPYSYGVMLLADGDRMGELLDKANSLKEHQDITEALSKFAESVANTMREYDGHCIYAGGDDVLGFVPLNQAYDCSKKLSEDFKAKLAKVSRDLKVEQSPTLSVGLAICHIMTPMSVIRDLASQAEKYAKGDHINDDLSQRRNALSLLLSVRSGNDVQIRYQWSDKKGLNAFQTWIELYLNKKIPSRVAYDIRDIHLTTFLMAEHQSELRQNIRLAELQRMLKKARTINGQKIETDTIQDIKDRAMDIDLNQLANELIVARWFAAKTQRELGKE